MAKGADFTDKNLTGKEMKAAGLTFACRYISGHQGGWKELSLPEAKEKSAAGILLVSNWEDTGHPKDSEAAGEIEAETALVEAHKCGMPAFRPIYFSIDFNAKPAAFDSYFRGVKHVLGAAYTGCYGSAALIQHLHGAGLIKWGWRTQSTGWYGGASTADCQIVQSGGSTVHGTSIDRDTSLTADIGGWVIGGNYGQVLPPPKGVVYTHPLVEIPKPFFDEQALAWQTQMRLHHKSNVVADGLYGPYSKSVAEAFQKYAHLKVDGVVGPLTWAASFK